MKKLTGIKGLGKYVKRHKGSLFLICVFSIFVTVINLLPIQAIGLLIDTLNGQKLGKIEKILSYITGNSAVNIIVGFGLIYFLSSVLSTVYGYVIALFNNKIIEEVRKDIFTSVIGREKQMNRQEDAADIVTRSVGDIESITRVIAGPLNGFLQKILSFVFSMIILGTWNLKVVVITVIVSGFLYYFSVDISEKNKMRGNEERGAVQKISITFSDILHNLLLVKSYRTEQRESARLSDVSDHLYGRRKKLLQEMSWYWIKIYLFNAVSYLLIFFVILSEIRNGNCSVGEIIVAYTYLENIFSAIISVSRYKTDIFNADASLVRVFELIEDRENVSAPDDRQQMTDCGAGSLRVEQLSLGYGGHRIVENVNFEVKAGELLVITGSSGAGKSTVLNGILGFTDILDGKILLNDIDVTRDTGTKRRMIRACFQDAYLFNGTLGENLYYDSEEPNYTKLWKEFGAADILEEKGADYMLDGLTNNLSGGQKRRIAIARTLNKKVSVYFFDEPTSELDKKNRDAVIRAFLKLKGKVTVVAVSHDKEFTDIADKVYVVS